MTHNILKAFKEFQGILVVCPHCNQIHRLSEIKLSYRGKVKRTWLDNLEAREAKLERAEELYKEKLEEIKERAREKGRKQLPKLLKKSAPVICKHGYFPQDVKALFDPVDFVIFDGMNLKEKVKRVVLFDGPTFDSRRERAQDSIKTVIRKGNYGWRTVKIDEKTGQVLNPK